MQTVFWLSLGQNSANRAHRFGKTAAKPASIRFALRNICSARPTKYRAGDQASDMSSGGAT
jgi:hypothetical protein